MSHENRRQTLTKSGKMALSSESFNIKKKANLFSLRKNRISRIFLYFKKAKPYLEQITNSRFANVFFEI